MHCPQALFQYWVTVSLKHVSGSTGRGGNLHETEKLANSAYSKEGVGSDPTPINGEEKIIMVS